MPSPSGPQARPRSRTSLTHSSLRLHVGTRELPAARYSGQ
jgi:hypothetical protein